jgi:hypothetical protein
MMVRSVGRTGSIFSLLVLWLAMAGAAGADPLEIVASIHGDAEPEDPPAVTVVAEPVSGSTGAEEEIRAEMRVPGRVSIELGDRDRGVWEVHLEAPGWWSPTISVSRTRGAEPSIVRSTLWPTGTITAKLRDVDEARGRVTAEFAPERGSGRTEPRGQSDCRIVEELARCEVPVGAHLLRMGLEGHVPRYFFGRRVDAGKELDLGELSFEPGASISGWVEREDGEPLGDRVVVAVRPGAGTELASVGKLRVRNHRAVVEENGFFQITGVRDGTVVLQAEVDPEGPEGEARFGLEMVSRPLETQVVEDRESRLRYPLVLLSPLKLAVVVEPPTDVWGEPWDLLVGAIGRVGGQLTPVREGKVPLSGYWEMEGLAPGEYLVKVVSSSEEQSSFAKVRLGEDLLPVLIELDGIAVEGEVLLGDEPVVAKIWFGGRYGAEKVTVQSDEEGRFSTALPRSGDWYLEVEAEDPPVQTEISAVEVEPDGSGEAAWVEIHLPDTRVAGRVVDEEGRGVRALVNAVPGEDQTMVQKTSEDDGSFEVRGLPEGLVSVEAVARHPRSPRMVLQSKRRILTLSEGSEPSPIELVLESQKPLNGRVMSPDGPVPGARLGAVSTPFTGHDNPVFPTDGEGIFETGVPPSARQVSLTTAAPGYALTSRVVPVGEEDSPPILIRLGEAAGTLELPERSEDGSADTYDALYLDGAEVHQGLLNQWASIHPGEAVPRAGYRVIPRMAPGLYRLCRRLEPWSGKAPSEVPPPRCTEGYLAPGAVLALDLPDDR